MSGGSMDYLYFKVQDADFTENTMLRRVFRVHLQKVAAALRAIEWHDSGDGGDNEDALILAAIEGEQPLLAQTITETHEAQDDLTRALHALTGEP